MKEFDVLNWYQPDQQLQYIESKKYFLRFGAIIASLVVIPLTIKNFYQGDFYLGLLTLSFITLLLAEVISIHLRNKTLLHYSITLGFLIATTITPIYQVGLYGTIWVFPLIIIFYFLTPYKSASVSSIITIFIASILSFIKFEPGLAIRLFLAWTISAIICSVIRSNISRLQDHLREQSSEDPLTGALNRRQFEIFLEHCIHQNQRLRTSAALILVDIDNFKAINDQLGHAVGDNAIKIVVQTLEQHSRKEDLLFRIGGDEMALLLQNISPENALELSNKLCQLIHQKFPSPDAGKPMSISIGLAFYHSSLDRASWFGRADSALYQAKNRGRNQAALYKPSSSKVTTGTS